MLLVTNPKTLLTIIIILCFNYVLLCFYANQKRHQFLLFTVTNIAESEVVLLYHKPNLIPNPSNFIISILQYLINVFNMHNAVKIVHTGVSLLCLFRINMKTSFQNRTTNKDQNQISVWK